MNEVELQNQITEARMLAVAGPAIVPLLERRKELTYQKLLGLYRDGGKDFLPIVGELFVVQGLLNEIKVKVDSLEKLTQKKEN